MVERWREGREGGREGTRMMGEKGEGQKRREIGRVIFWEGREKDSKRRRRYEERERMEAGRKREGGR